MSSWHVETDDHSIYFKKTGQNSYKNSWSDFKMFATNRPVINPAKPVTNYVEVPGMSGALDYTEALRNKVVEEYNTGNWEFQIWNDSTSWTIQYSILLDYFDGDEFEVYLKDKPSKHYKGHIRVSDYKTPTSNMTTVQLAYDLIKM